MSTVNPMLRRANTIVRSQRPHEAESWEYTIRKQDICFTDPRRTAELTFIFFRSFGCRFDRRGECTMCNYGVAEHTPAERIIDIVARALTENDHYEALGISPFGNMFDTFEVADEARRAIFQMAAATDCETYSCESRPETMTEDNIRECVGLLGDKRLMVNLGLESAVPWVQTNCVGKSLDRDSYETAVRLLRHHDSWPITNVLLGAPFLDEHEAIDSAVHTMRWAIEAGTRMCVLFPSNIKGWTLQKWLWERGLYSPPSLWSVVEAVHRLGADLAGQVALSWYSTEVSDPVKPKQISDPTLAVPTTCPSCRTPVVDALARYNATGDFTIIDDLHSSDCACHTSYVDRMEHRSPTTALDRATTGYARIGTELLGESWWATNRSTVLAQLAEDLEHWASISAEDPVG